MKKILCNELNAEMARRKCNDLSQVDGESNDAGSLAGGGEGGGGQKNNCCIRNYSGQKNCLMNRTFLGIPCNITASTIYLKSSNTIVMYNLRHLLFQNNDPVKYCLFFGLDSGFRVMMILFCNFRHE